MHRVTFVYREVASHTVEEGAVDMAVETDGSEALLREGPAREHGERLVGRRHSRLEREIRDAPLRHRGA